MGAASVHSAGIRMKRPAGTWLLFSLILLAAPAARHAWAIDLRATPFLSLLGGWDSNITSVVDNGISGPALKAYPGLTLSTGIFQTAMDVTGRMGFEYFPGNTDQNTYSRNWALGLNFSDPIRATENLTILPQARYIKSNDLYSRNSSMFGNQDQVLSNQPVPVTSTTLTEYAGGLNLDYLLTSATTVYFNTLAGRDSYSAPGYLDTTFANGTVGFTTQTSQRFSIGPSLAAAYTDFSNGERSIIFTLALNSTIALGEFDSFILGAGASRWSLEGNPLNPERRDGWSPYVNARYRYDRETWHATAGAAYQTQASGGLLSVVDSVTGDIYLMKNLTPLWSASIGSSYTKNIGVTDSGNMDYSWFNQATIRYQMYESIGISLTAAQMYTNYNNLGGTENTVERTNVFLGIDARQEYRIF